MQLWLFCGQKGKKDKYFICTIRKFQKGQGGLGSPEHDRFVSLWANSYYCLQIMFVLLARPSASGACLHLILPPVPSGYYFYSMDEED